MYLQNAVFNQRDFKEVRFLCTERAKGNKKYLHFKKMNRELIEVAMSGDQSGFLKINKKCNYLISCLIYENNFLNKIFNFKKHILTNK